MSIRPIDMQTMIPKLERADAARHKAATSAETSVQQSQLQSKIDAEHLQNQVITAKQKEQRALKNDDREKHREKNAKDGGPHHDGTEDENGQKKATSKIGRGHIDLKV